MVEEAVILSVGLGKYQPFVVVSFAFIELLGMQKMMDASVSGTHHFPLFHKVEKVTDSLRVYFWFVLHVPCELLN